MRAPDPSAAISACGKYRYHLGRKGTRDFNGPCGGTALWVMLNPSTADAQTDDPTIRKCLGFAQRLGFSRIEVVNLFAYRATDPRSLIAAAKQGVDVVGPLNDAFVADAVEKADLVICAWGNHALAKPLVPRLKEVRSMLAHVKTWCVGRSMVGTPRHPLMVAYDTPLQNYAW